MKFLYFWLEGICSEGDEISTIKDTISGLSVESSHFLERVATFAKGLQHPK